MLRAALRAAVGRPVELTESESEKSRWTGRSVWDVQRTIYFAPPYHDEDPGPPGRLGRRVAHQPEDVLLSKTFRVLGWSLTGLASWGSV